MAKFWARRDTAGAWRSKSSLPCEHGRPCCSHVSRRACDCEVDRMHASHWACTADCSHASRRACTADFSRSSRLIKQLHARHRVWLNFGTKYKNDQWTRAEVYYPIRKEGRVAALKLLREHMVHIIQSFAILTCQLFASKGLRWLLLCVPYLKLDDFFSMTYMCHVMKPCQVSCFLGEFSIYWDLKTEILNVLGRREVCSSLPFLQRDLNMHPMTHVWFSTHFCCRVEP